MAKGTRKTGSGKTRADKAKAVAERAMPGWKAVEPAGPVRPFGAGPYTDSSAKAPVDAVMPSTEALHRKFFGGDRADAAPPPDKALGDNVEVVEMKSGDLQRTVGVNPQTEKIEWSQG